MAEFIEDLRAGGRFPKGLRVKGIRHLLADIARLLRDRAALAGEDVAAGIDDLRSGRITRLDRRTELGALRPPR